jgi:hypothetical protein|tara:strand:- start:403 stop:621 length:219 start_codon:yes stop_codon:yes gene_type:complete
MDQKYHHEIPTPSLRPTAKLLQDLEKKIQRADLDTGPPSPLVAKDFQKEGPNPSLEYPEGSLKTSHDRADQP